MNIIMTPAWRVKENDLHEDIPPQVEQVPKGAQVPPQGDEVPILEVVNDFLAVPLELSNRDIREAFLTLARAVTTHENSSMVPIVNVVENTMMSRLRDLLRMNPPIFLVSKVELASYKLKDVSQVWYTQWKDTGR
ncbi:hypothetical protein EJD97_005529 [Solanum chilense]|uniref:Uncharacterized protein n=1 Tax=Solanum chilense TaxID=4083 RepID=A0A6N2BS93_SOLCI|nr:hypothetical protein EJD97_005529 [Solanum chilense]